MAPIDNGWLHGQIHHYQTLIGDWEALRLDNHGPVGKDVWEYRVDIEPHGTPQRYTGNFAVPAGTDPIVVTAQVLTRAAEYLS